MSRQPEFTFEQLAQQNLTVYEILAEKDKIIATLGEKVQNLISEKMMLEKKLSEYKEIARLGERTESLTTAVNKLLAIQAQDSLSVSLTVAEPEK